MVWLAVACACCSEYSHVAVRCKCGVWAAYARCISECMCTRAQVCSGLGSTQSEVVPRTSTVCRECPPVFCAHVHAPPHVHVYYTKCATAPLVGHSSLRLCAAQVYGWAGVGVCACSLISVTVWCCARHKGSCGAQMHSCWNRPVGGCICGRACKNDQPTP